MSRKESKFYIIIFMNPRIISFKRNFEHHLSCIFRNLIKKLSRKKRDVCKGCKWIRTTLLLMLRYIYFCWIKFCVKPVTNKFVSCTLLTICFFFWLWFRKICRPFFYNFWHSSFRLICIFTLHVAIWTWILGS